MVILPEAIAPQEDIVIRGLSGTSAGTRDLVIMGGIAAFSFEGRLIIIIEMNSFLNQFPHTRGR
jgi:hypothetical protein